MRKDNGWNSIVIHLSSWFIIKQTFCQKATGLDGYRCQFFFTSSITEGINAGNTSLLKFIDCNMARWSELNTGCFKIELIYIWFTTDSPENLLSNMATTVFKMNLDVTILCFFKTNRCFSSMKWEIGPIHFFH